MLSERLLETVAEHTRFLDNIAERGINWSDRLEFYGVLHALQLHAQAVIDYLLHACSLLSLSIDTPLRCITALRDEGLLGSDEAELLRRLVRFRNLIVHEYARVDAEVVKRVLRERGFRRAFEAVARLHDRLRKRGIADP